jgi:hypothetical protein
MLKRRKKLKRHSKAQSWVRENLVKYTKLISVKLGADMSKFTIDRMKTNDRLKNTCKS